MSEDLQSELRPAQGYCARVWYSLADSLPDRGNILDRKGDEAALESLNRAICLTSAILYQAICESSHVANIPFVCR